MNFAKGNKYAVKIAPNKKYKSANTMMKIQKILLYYNKIFRYRIQLSFLLKDQFFINF